MEFTGFCLLFSAVSEVNIEVEKSTFSLTLFLSYSSKPTAPIIILPYSSILSSDSSLKRDETSFTLAVRLCFLSYIALNLFLSLSRMLTNSFSSLIPFAHWLWKIFGTTKDAMLKMNLLYARSNYQRDASTSKTMLKCHIDRWFVTRSGPCKPHKQWTRNGWECWVHIDGIVLYRRRISYAYVSIHVKIR